MKIAILAPSKSIHTHKWALYYKKKGIEVKVYTFDNHYSEANAKEVDTVRLPMLLPGKISYLTAVSHLKRMLNEWKPDILHSHFISSYGLVGTLSKYQPHFTSVWGKDIFVFPKQNIVNRKLVELTLSKAAAICSTSHVMAKETNLYTNRPIYVTPFGVDLNLFYPSDITKELDEEIIIGTVKALEDKYGIGDLIRAFAEFRKHYPTSKLLIAGDGPQRQEYEELTRSLGIEEETTFTGRIPNTEVPELIRKMTIFAVPSTEDSESFGVAAVEAMACGIPVVVSNVGGLPEVVIEGRTGLIVDKNRPDQLAASFNKLASDPELRKQMGQNGVAHVKSLYDWEQNAEYMLSLYEKHLVRG